MDVVSWIVASAADGHDVAADMALGDVTRSYRVTNTCPAATKSKQKIMKCKQVLISYCKRWSNKLYHSVMGIEERTNSRLLCLTKFAFYLHKIGLVYGGVDSITLRLIQ